MQEIASSIAAVRQAWLDAVQGGDVERLATLVTDDIVIVHGNGRCICGKEALKADFLTAFQTVRIEQNVSSPEVVVRGGWAFDIGEVETSLIPRSVGEPMRVRSTTVVALRRQPDGSWKVGRVLGLLHSQLFSSK